MKNKNTKKQQKKRKKNINPYEWGQKYKKLFAAIICIILVFGLLAGLLQI